MTQPYVVKREMDGNPWPAGPWDTEPDALAWVSPSDQACLAARTDEIGTWCGYVVVPEGHVLHGMQAGDVQELLVEAGVRIHGGITWSAENPSDKIAAPGWWIGFDCAHYYDQAPGFLAMGLGTLGARGIYRTLEFVRAEVDRLAGLVAEMPQVVSNA